MRRSNSADHLDEGRVIHYARDSYLIHGTPIWAGIRLEDLRSRCMSYTGVSAAL